MKDFTTAMGMPFATIDKQNFDQWVETVSGLLPGIDRRYLYDLLSFDAMEVCASGLSAAGVVFALKDDDQEKLAEMLGAMGVSSIAAANPILGVLTIAATAYAYRQNQQVDVIAAVKGGGLAAVSAAMFAVLGFPILVELVIVVTLSTLLKKHVIDNAQLTKWIGEKLNEELRSRTMELLDVRWLISKVPNNLNRGDFGVRSITDANHHPASHPWIYKTWFSRCQDETTHHNSGLGSCFDDSFGGILRGRESFSLC